MTVLIFISWHMGDIFKLNVCISKKNSYPKTLLSQTEMENLEKTLQEKTLILSILNFSMPRNNQRSVHFPQSCDTNTEMSDLPEHPADEVVVLLEVGVEKVHVRVGVE